MAIALDFGGTIFAAIHVDIANGGNPQKEYIRHIVLNSIRHYNKMWRDEYGELIICVDSDSWRDKVFQFYKWVRRQNRGDDGNDWEKIFEYVYEIQDDLREHFPYQVLQAPGAEADDIISYLAKTTKEPLLIISNDKDLAALTQFPLVDQYRPMEKGGELYVVDDPKRFEFELCITGDKVDGIPSILCADDFLKTQFEIKESGGKTPRAPSVSAKFKQECWDAFTNGGLNTLNVVLGEERFKRFERNHNLISFDAIPEDVVYQIEKAIKIAKPAPIMKTLMYMTGNRMNLLAKEIADFKVNKTPRKKVSLFDM